MSDGSVRVIWLDRYVGNPPVKQIGHLIVNGHHVPHIEIMRSSNMALDGEIEVIAGEKYCIHTDETTLDDWGWLLGEAMAIAAGYPTLMPPFAGQVMMIDTVSTEDGEQD